MSIFGTMSSNWHKRARKFQSGAQKRKQMKKKDENLQKVLSKIPKIGSYFSVSMKQQSNKNVTVSINSETPSLSQDLRTNDSINVASEDPKTSLSVLEMGNSNISNVGVTIDTETECEEPSETEKTGSQNDNNYQNYIGLWRKPFSNEMTDFWIAKGSDHLQKNNESLFITLSAIQHRTDRPGERKCSTNLFFRFQKNKEIIPRK